MLRYRYTLVVGGRETARSPEAELVLPGRPAAHARLLPNAPNPFNPRTTIRFELARAGRTRVTVHDAAGRLVASLAEGHLTAGPHSRLWSGRDTAGRRLPSGAYFVRLETPERVDHRKIMLLQ